MTCEMKIQPLMASVTTATATRMPPARGRWNAPKAHRLRRAITAAASSTTGASGQM